MTAETIPERSSADWRSGRTDRSAGQSAPDCPLAMPIQDFAKAPAMRVSQGGATHMAVRRGILLGGSGVIGLVASCGLAVPLAVDGFDVIDQAMVLLSLALFSWLALGFLNTLFGLMVLLRARHGGTLPVPLRLPHDRVAVLIPIYNEDVTALEPRIARMAAELAQAGAASWFDIFVLSDSGASAEREEAAMCRRLRGLAAVALHYRRRPLNTGRKPGNVAEWVRRCGGAYPAMIVLDADSLMYGRAMLRMALALEDDPALGLIQTNPQVTGARTLFARWQQFSTAFYGPISSAGLNWWSGDEATFWGHNAIIRTRAFAESCGLPLLKGEEPLGGPILSHDMVEAALLRRRGWRVRMMVMDEGSYEESPPTLVDHAIRDRRWCQGNLQHLRLLDMPGLHWISRLQLLMGASAYLTSPLWLVMLAVGLFVAVRTGTPMADLGAPAWLIALTLMLLFGPRLLALAWAGADPALVRRLGGWRAILVSVPADMLFAIIAAPAIMASQCIAIADILGGHPSGWRPQRRQSDGIALGEALDRYRWHMLLGLVFWTVSLSELGGGVWSLPVALGLLGAPFIATATSRADLGMAAARHGIFGADPVTASTMAIAAMPMRTVHWSRVPPAVA